MTPDEVMRLAVEFILLATDIIEVVPGSPNRQYRMKGEESATPVIPEPIKNKLVGLGREQKKVLDMAKSEWTPITADIKRIVLSLEKRGLVIVQENQFKLADTH